jgi:hypothetical protein
MSITLDPSSELDWPEDETGKRKIITGPIGQVDNEYGRTYEKPGDSDFVCQGVTGVIGDTTNKPALPVWASNIAAEAAVRQINKLIGLMGATPLLDENGNFWGVSEGTPEGHTAAIKWLKGESKRLRELASEIGRHQHDILEALILDVEIPAVPDHLIGVEIDGERVDHDEISDGFLNFITDWAPEFIAAEATVCNTLHMTAGTLDFMALMPKMAPVLKTLPWFTEWDAEQGKAVSIFEGRDFDKRPPLGIGDAKTGKNLYEKAIREQLNEYGRSDEVWLDGLGNTMEMPEVDFLAVLHIRKDFHRGYKLRLVPWDDKAHERFMYRRAVVEGGHNDTKFTGEVVYPPLPDGSQPPPLIEDVPAFGRCASALKKAGFISMADFEAQTQADLLSLTGVGPAALKAIGEQLAAKSLPAIVRSSDEELLAIKGVTKKALAEIRVGDVDEEFEAELHQINHLVEIATAADEVA